MNAEHESPRNPEHGPPPELLTVGHSNHEFEHFAALLQQHRVDAIADVRSEPYSRYTPQFGYEALKAALARLDIAYVFLGEELGARRKEAECYVDGVAQYRLIAGTPAFRAGLERVRRGLDGRRIALMCAEKDPLTCHRTILVCRALRDSGIAIRHILEDGGLESMRAAETRLLELFDLPEGDLFRTREELIEEAYDRQAERIQYRTPADEEQVAR